MREIKFRAWDTIKKRFLQGKEWKEVLLTDGFLDANSHLKIMQFTGLKDKNGKDVYEGDIGKWDKGRKDELILLIKIGDYQLQTYYEIIKQKNKNCVSYDIRLYRTGDDFEVIGNIYENPELLKEDMKNG